MPWLTIALCLLAAAGAALSAPPAKAGAPDEAPSASIEAQITEVHGKVTVYLHDHQDDEGIAAKEGTPLEEGDRVVTGPDGEAEIGLDADSLIALGPRSAFTLTSLERRDSRFGLSAGSLFSKIRALFKSGGGLRVETPTAVAAVRGTEFAVEQAEEGLFRAAVFEEGSVWLSAPNGKGGKTLLAAREETFIERGTKNFYAIRVAPLAHFAGMRQQMKWVARGAETLSKNWKTLTPERRSEIRARQVESGSKKARPKAPRENRGVRSKREQHERRGRRSTRPRH